MPYATDGAHFYDRKEGVDVECSRVWRTEYCAIIVGVGFIEPWAFTLMNRYLPRVDYMEYDRDDGAIQI